MSAGASTQGAMPERKTARKGRFFMRRFWGDQAG